MKDKMNTQNVSLAGEFFVLAQLSLRGYIGTLTLGHTKGVDILVSNEKTGNMFRLEVKTASKGPWRTNIFGNNYEWMMDIKHETIIDNKLFYCFVYLKNLIEMPLFFIVPSNIVANYCVEEHKKWFDAPRKNEVKETTMRTFRIGIDPDAHGLPLEKYENKWDYFD